MDLAGVDHIDLSASARSASDEAARRAGVTVFMLQESEDIHAAHRLFGEIWNVDGSEPVMTSTLMKAFVHSGNYVSGAFFDGNLVAASVGFVGQVDNGVYLHSHITGVVPRLQVRGVGFAVKQHQRAWALDQGLGTITWTFDPLVRRNGYFNITKLGAEITGYHTNFYGLMQDGINNGDDSDRCVVTWRLDSRRAIDAAAGASPDQPLDLAAAETIVTESPDGDPVLNRGEGQLLMAFVPRDIVQLRRDDPRKASAWREAVRDAFMRAFDRGYVVTGMARQGCYVLRRPD